MGLLRDIVGSAINNGASGVNNGFSDRNKSGLIGSVRDRAVSYSSSGSWSQRPASRQYGGDFTDRRQSRGNSSDGGYFRSQQPYEEDDNYYRKEEYADRQTRPSMVTYPPARMSPVQRSNIDSPPPLPPAYAPSAGVNQPWYHDEQPATRGLYTNMNPGQNGQFSQINNFRPLVLPQIAYGDGQPFLRGYSPELGRYNVTLESFIPVIDRINTAILPSPENQLFQKGANIAGFFLPGASGIALSVGQVAVGLGTAAGYSAKVSSALSEANMNLFLPNGLELCIGTSADVDAMFGINSDAGRSSAGATAPEERLAYYNGLVAPLSNILPPERQGGRQDPIALLGNQVSRRNDVKKIEKAQKKMQKGKSKQLDSLEAGLKWLIVRQARPQ